MSQEVNPFAYVIIDGDGAVFREDLIAEGEDGGSQAAHELHASLQNFLQEAYNLPHIEIFVQVVLNLEGLTKALFVSGALKGVEDRACLAKFGRGFARAQPLFSFNDVGWGKEQADHRVRKALEMMEKNLHCRAVILGGCHDNGYATFLEPFRNSRKISLLQTTPAAAGFSRLPFKTTSIPSVFRSEPLHVVARQIPPPPGFRQPTPTLAKTYTVTSPITANPNSASPKGKPSTPVATTTASRSTKENEKPSGSWASVGRLSGTPQIIDISTRKPAAKERAFYQLNKDNQRVDVPIPKVDPSAQESFNEKMRKNGTNFCNRFHLLGSCKQFEVTGHCPYVHGDRLSAAEQATLRTRARGLPCNSGSKCTDPHCTSGHHCTVSKTCPNQASLLIGYEQNPKSCWFDEGCRFADVHGMDTVSAMASEVREFGY